MLEFSTLGFSSGAPGIADKDIFHLPKLHIFLLRDFKKAISSSESKCNIDAKSDENSHLVSTGIYLNLKRLAASDCNASLLLRVWAEWGGGESRALHHPSIHPSLPETLLSSDPRPGSVYGSCETETNETKRRGGTAVAGRTWAAYKPHLSCESSVMIEPFTEGSNLQTMSITAVTSKVG